MSATRTSPATEAFIERWRSSGGAERANYALFLSELCDIIDVPKPEPMRPDPEANQYVFEKPVTFHHPDGTTSTGRIDLYKRDCFVLEAKQGVEKVELPESLTGKKKKLKTGTATRGTRSWHDAMLSARGQAEQYAKALPEWPPFISVVDVGHVIELYADFERQGKNYLPFPGPRDHRIYLPDLTREPLRERLHHVWTDPLDLDPSRKQAEVTREVAVHLAKLAKALEAGGHEPKLVAEFLSRCLFTMFAEDVGMLPRDAFTQLLERHRDRPEVLSKLMAALWADMNEGGFSTVITENVLRFNGGLFADQDVIHLTTDQIDLLIEAAHSDWSNVEPSIFGTLLERALDPRERHKLGAHFTPREYVERLVMPTVIEPLRREWDAVKAASISLERQVDPDDPKTDKYRKEAIKSLTAFHDKLCDTRVLDPACGSGNFLYVTFEHMKRLEGEVLQTLADHGETEQKLELQGVTVDPHQFLGIEINPRAASIADMVLWLGYLKWHFKTHGKVNPPEPVLRDFKNIECRDAVLEWDDVIPLVDAAGEEVTQWDGETYKKHSVTGDDVPDEKARRKVWKFVNPRKAKWPEADYVVSNPPFVGNKMMRIALGDGYTEAIRSAWSDVPGSCDYVMLWWDKACRLIRNGSIHRFGFITTNSITQSFNRKIVELHLAAENNPVSVVWAIADHPWVDDGADVRIAMTVGISTVSEHVKPVVGCVADSQGEGHDTSEVAVRITAKEVPRIHSDLSFGADVSSTVKLTANAGLAFMGMTLIGKGFRLSREEVRSLGYDPDSLPPVIRPYLNAREMMQERKDRFVVDLHGLDSEDVLKQHPTLYQRLLERVKPEREHNKDPGPKKNWWLFGRSRPDLRRAVVGLARYIITPETSKHRIFTYAESDLIPDHTLYAICLSDPYFLGVLSSRCHTRWSLSSGSRMGIGNDPRWRNARCFDPFPFPELSQKDGDRIRELAVLLDKHRQIQLSLHPMLTFTTLYNVLEKLRGGYALTKKDKQIHDEGLCSVLLQLHDDLDKAVFDAYGWPSTLTDEEILERLVALNAERAEEEKRGIIRWLRPEFQAPKEKKGEQGRLGGAAPAKATKKKAGTKDKKKVWPKDLVGRVQAVQTAMESTVAPVSATDVSKMFTRARKKDVEQVLETLASLGKLQRTTEGLFTA